MRLKNSMARTSPKIDNLRPPGSRTWAETRWSPRGEFALVAQVASALAAIDDCSNDTQVGTCPGQVAINEACGRAYADAKANVRKQDQWVQILWG